MGKGNTLITAAGAADVSFDTQLTTVESALAERTKAEQLVKQYRMKCIDILTTHKVDLGGRPLEPEMLENVLARIKILGKPAELDEEAQLIYETTFGEYAKYMLEKQRMLPLLEKYFGKKGIDFLKRAKTIYETGPPPALIDKVATAKARKEFKVEFAKFREALESYEQSSSTIANIKEYVGIVQDISSIANNRRKGDK